MLTLLISIPVLALSFLGVVGSFYRSVSVINTNMIKSVVLAITIFDLLLSLYVYVFFDISSNQFQFVKEHFEVGYFNIYLGLDGLSTYFVLLTTIITPISLISNWKSIKENVISFLSIILLLETLLLIVFLVLDILLFYIFFESILAPLFIIIGLYGSKDKVKASFYFFLYTLWGSLFMLLSIITIMSLLGTADLDIIYKNNFFLFTQLFMFYGIFLAFSVKTPIIYLNSWLLKAHVESPLTGSIVLAAIVLKLSLYGILRLILPILPKAFIYYTYIIFLIGIITIFYASLSTLRTVDIKELIAYSSVCHAAVYLVGAFSNILHAICGAITLGLAHGFVSSGLFICAGGVLYDRSSTRSITYYKGMTQIMPLFSILFFILCLGNCSAPLTLNFLGEFLSLYGVFERLPLAGVLASSSIIFSAAYTIFMFNRICFAGTIYKDFWVNYIPDLKKREFFILLSLAIFTIFLGIYPAPVLNGLNYYVSYLIYCFQYSTVDSINYIGLAFFPAFLYNNSISFNKRTFTTSQKHLAPGDKFLTTDEKGEKRFYIEEKKQNKVTYLVPIKEEDLPVPGEAVKPIDVKDKGSYANAVTNGANPYIAPRPLTPEEYSKIVWVEKSAEAGTPARLLERDRCSPVIPGPGTQLESLKLDANRIAQPIDNPLWPSNTTTVTRCDDRGKPLQVFRDFYVKGKVVRQELNSEQAKAQRVELPSVQGSAQSVPQAQSQPSQEVTRPAYDPVRDNRGNGLNRSINKEEVLKLIESKLEKLSNNENYNYLYAYLDLDLIRFLAIIIFAFLFPALWLLNHFNISESNFFEMLYLLPYISLGVVILGIMYAICSGTIKKQIEQRDYLSLSLYPLYCINPISFIILGYPLIVITVLCFGITIVLAKRTKSYKNWGILKKTFFVFNALLIILRVLYFFLV